MASPNYTFSGNGKISILNSFISSPTATGEYILPLKDLTENYVLWEDNFKNNVVTNLSWSTMDPGDSETFIIRIEVRNSKMEELVDTFFQVFRPSSGFEFSGPEDVTIDLQNTEFIAIKYSLGRLWNNGDNTVAKEATLTFYVSVVNNRLPLKKWTVTDVVNRILRLAEPLKIGQEPRFTFDGVTYDNRGNVDTGVGYAQGSQAEYYEKILAPEFAMPKMNLREQLKQVGGFINAEPRLIFNNEFTEDGRAKFKVVFDKYGGKEYAKIKAKSHISKQLTHDINEYNTNLDSQAENLVSQLDYAQGVVVEPFDTGWKTLRAENTTIRIEENNALITTELPIYKIGGSKQVFCMYIPFGDDQAENTNNGLGWDITPYIFELTDYDGNLSSYSGVFPYSKNYALYYVQGQKNINAMFFKPEVVWGEATAKYAIIKILEEVTGKSLGDITGQKLIQLGFRVNYLPIAQARVKTNKAIVVGGLPSAINYNQSANMVETRYYGENLKGVSARLGNVEKTLTYKVAFLSDIPKSGDLYDDDYCISAVSTEIQPFFIKVTIGLSRDFIGLSEYVGISSNKRMWEVSEKQAQQRDRVVSQYLVISEKQVLGDNAWFTPRNSDGEIIGLVDTFLPRGDLEPVKTIDKALCRQYNRQGQQVGASIVMPVVSTAFGNSLHFSFKLQDNYSAGQQSDYVETDAVSGYWGNYVSYCDYYGRFYEWYISFYSNGRIISQADNNSPAFKLPQFAGFVGTNPLGREIIGYTTKYDKDSREIPSEAYQLMAVTDESKIIIGSALMRNCGLVNRSPEEIQLVLFKEKISNMGGKIDFSNLVEGTDYLVDNSLLHIVGAGYHFFFTSTSFSHKAWAVTTVPNTTGLEVEDDAGNVSTQIIYKGGEIVIGQNKPIYNNKTIYFNVVDRVYE